MFQPNIISDQREAEQHSSAITGQTIVAAARLIRSALSNIKQDLQTREPPVVDLATATDNQKSAYVVAITTERYGIPQPDGGKSLETDKYRFSVSQEGIYRVADKESNWVLLKFQANRDFAQAQVADLTEKLISEKENYTPDTAEAAAETSVDNLLDGPNNKIDLEAVQIADIHYEPALADEDELANSQIIPEPNLNQQASEKQESQPVVETNPQIRIEEDLETDKRFEHTLPDLWANSQPINPASPAQSRKAASTHQPTPEALAIAQIADQLVEESGAAVTPPQKAKPKVETRGYASEEFEITQVDNLYDIRDKSGNSVFSFIKDENRYEILEDNLSAEQRQQFVRAYDNVQEKGLDAIMADPTGNRQIENLGDLAPEGSKAIAFTHQNLSEQQKISGIPGPNFQTESDKYRFIKEDDTITITAQIDGRVVASSEADGRITANFLDGEEVGSFSNAYGQMKQQAQQQAQQSAQASGLQQGQTRQPVDMER